MSKRRVLRGSAYFTDWGLNTTLRTWLKPESRVVRGGFRIVIMRGKP